MVRQRYYFRQLEYPESAVHDSGRNRPGHRQYLAQEHHGTFQHDGVQPALTAARATCGEPYCLENLRTYATTSTILQTAGPSTPPHARVLLQNFSGSSSKHSVNIPPTIGSCRKFSR